MSEIFIVIIWSPIEANATFSDTDPPVALTHIFCGQIKVKSTGEKRAEGFHSRPGNTKILTVLKQRVSH